MMDRRIHIGLLRTSISCLFIFLAFYCFPQKRLSFYLGAGPNWTFCQYFRSGGIKVESKGLIATTFDLSAKISFGRHFSIAPQYSRINSRINLKVDDVRVDFVDRYTSTRTLIGYMSFRDQISINGNQIGLNLNYEASIGKNNISAGIGFNRAYYDCKQNKITRSYETLPTNSDISNIDRNQSSELTGPNLNSINLSFSFERLFIGDRLGAFGRVNYIYNIKIYSFDYKHSSMGLTSGYSYYGKNGGSSDLRSYTYTFQTLNFTIGAFYNINFKTNEKPKTH